MTEPNSARRLAVVGVLVLALFAGLLTRLWFLQVTGGEKLAVAAQRQRDAQREAHSATSDESRTLRIAEAKAHAAAAARQWEAAEVQARHRREHGG